MAGDKRYQLAVQIVGDIAASFGTTMAKAEKDITSLYRTSARNNAGIVKGINALSATSDKVFGAMIKGAEMAAIGIGAIVAASTFVGASFEAQMSTVQSISGATSSEMELLSFTAKEMGRTTQFSATESGKAMEYMAMAGWKTQDMISGIPGIMNLAAASGEELGTVSDIVTDALTAFGLKAKDTAMFADVLAQASNASNTDVAMMGETFKYVAPVAGSFGYNIQDTAVAIGLMANSGIKASQAGTSLRRILLSLGSGATLSGKAFGEMEIKTANADGSMRELHKVMEELRTGFSKLTEEEKAANAETIAGKTGIAGFLAIMNASEEDFQNLTLAINESAGAAEYMAGIRIDNLKGDAVLLASAAEGAGIAIYEGLSSPLRELTQLAIAWVESFVESDWLKNFTTEKIPTARRNLIEFGKSMKPLIDVGNWFLKNPKVLSSSIAGIGAALLTFKAAKGVMTIVKTLGALSGIMGAWPVMAAGAAIGLITGIGTAIAIADKEAAKADLASRFGEIALSAKELDEVSRNIVGKSLLDGIDVFRDASDSTSDFYTSLRKSVEEINKENWKLSLGMEFTEEDTKSYISDVESYIKNAQDYIESNGYELKLAANIVFGDTEGGKEFQDNNDAFTNSLLAQIEPIKQNISDTLAQITEEGLTLPKQELLNQYLGEMSELTQMITDAQNSAKLQIIEDQYKGLENLTADSFKNLQQSVGDYTKEAMAGVDKGYEQVLIGLNAQKLAGESGMEGGISQEEFKVKSEEARRGWLERKANTTANSQQALIDAIKNTYSEEVNGLDAKLDEALKSSLSALEVGIGGQFLSNPSLAWDTNLFQRDLGTSGMDKSAKSNMADLWQAMLPEYQEMQNLAQSFYEAGEALPQSLIKGMEDASKIGTLLGDQNAIFQLMAIKADQNPEYKKIIEEARKAGHEVPEAVASYLDGNVAATSPAVDNLYKHTQMELDMRFRSMEVNGLVNINLSGKLGELPMPPQYSGTPTLSKNVKIGKRAKGGIVTAPELSWIAEAGFSESVIPLDGSANALELWKETGKLIGAYEANKPTALFSQLLSPVSQKTESVNNNSSSPAFAPVIQIYGNTPQSVVEDAISNTYEQFKEWYIRIKMEEARVSW